MEVHSYLDKYSSGGAFYYTVADNVDGDEDCTYVDCTARGYHPSSGYFKTRSFQEWDEYGDNYQATWMETALTYVAA
jgi:hypothetical protein